jgi:RND family efflux transporter MFP subunit
MRRGTRLGVLVGLPVLLVAVGAVLAALLWIQRQGDGPVEQALSDARRSTGARAAESSTGASTSPAAQAQAASQAAGGRQTVPVRRGSIADQVTLTGRVAAADEVLLGFGISGKVESVSVKPGDTVQEGQLLMEAESATIQRELEAARGRVEVGALRSEQAQQQAQAKKRDVDRRVAADAARKEAATREAESAVRRAQADYERVKAGASPAERRTAESAVASAQVAYDAALAEYNRAFAGPGELETRQAEQAIAAARIALAAAEAELEKMGGPDPEELRMAERAMLTAQSSYARAVGAVEKVSQPDKTATTSAERDVQRAELSLRSAQAMRTNDRSSRLQKEISVRNAQADLQEARERLDQVREGAPAAEIEAARRDMIEARKEVDAARQRLDLVRQGPSSLEVDQARSAVESARLALAETEQKAAALAAGPAPDVAARLTVTVQQAQTSLESSQAGLAELNARPTKNELQDAEDRLAAAQAGLAAAQAEPEPEKDTTEFDIQVLERSLAQDRSQVETLERQLAQTRLRAPFTGTISGVKLQAGDSFEAERAVITLARPGQPVLRADVTDRDASRLATGQRAVVRLEAGDGGEFDASVDQVLEGANGVGRTVQLSALWPEPSPTIGTPVQVIVTLQEKENVLLIPQKSIRSAGARRFVEVVDGQNRTMTDVEIGIVSNGQAEVINGLRQDQLVLVNP